MIIVRRGQDVDEIALVVVVGEIGIDDVARLRTTIAELVTCRRYVVVDLDDATCADDTMLPDLVAATCAAAPSDVSLLFTDDPRRLMMLKVTEPTSGPSTCENDEADPGGPAVSRLGWR